MRYKNLILQAVISSICVVAYVAGVAWLMIHGEQLFGPLGNRGILGPTLFLLLFVFSATVVGLVVLGRPAYLFLTGLRREAVVLLVLTVIGLFVMTSIIFSLVLLIR